MVSGSAWDIEMPVAPAAIALPAIVPPRRRKFRRLAFLRPTSCSSVEGTTFEAGSRSLSTTIPGEARFLAGIVVLSFGQTMRLFRKSYYLKVYSIAAGAIQ